LAADRGYLSRSAMGLDYHPVVKGKLTSLGDFLKREAPGKKSIGFVDTGPFFDKAVAQRAGLGYYAGNTLLATELGTWVFLGGILTEVELTPTTPSPKGPSPKTCPLDCSLCIRSCPTGALIAPGVLDYKRCLSYLTQKKGYVPREFRKAMGLRLYGCDTCQDSCLANEGAQKSQHSQFYPSTKRLPKLSQLLKMNRREFNLCFGDSSAGWRGRTILQRNALIALGNMGDRALVPEVKALLGDSRSLLRGHAAWALGQLGGREARAALEKALTWESVEEVKEEIINALRGE
jgi:epoxyqueuosine reductase